MGTGQKKHLNKKGVWRFLAFSKKITLTSTTYCSVICKSKYHFKDHFCKPYLLVKGKGGPLGPLEGPKGPKEGPKGPPMPCAAARRKGAKRTELLVVNITGNDMV